MYLSPQNTLSAQWLQQKYYPQLVVLHKPTSQTVWIYNNFRFSLKLQLVESISQVKKTISQWRHESEGILCSPSIKSHGAFVFRKLSYEAWLLLSKDFPRPSYVSSIFDDLPKPSHASPSCNFRDYRSCSYVSPLLSECEVHLSPRRFPKGGVFWSRSKVFRRSV